MDAQPTFGPDDVLAHIVGDIAQAVCERPGETPRQQVIRSQVAVQTMMEFQPRDAIEAMLASHCLMFHEMIGDSVHVTLRSEEAMTRRATRAGIVAMDNAFGNNLARLERYRAPHADAHPAGTRAETDIADRVRRHQAASETRSRASDLTAPTAPEPGSSVLHYKAPETTAYSRAISPLNATDPGGLPHALGGNHPGEAYPEAATRQTAGLNRQARREIDRRARKPSGLAAPTAGAGSLARPGVMPTHNGPATITSATAAG